MRFSSKGDAPLIDDVLDGSTDAGVLQLVAVCRIVLLSVAAWCSVLQCVAVCCSVFSVQKVKIR